MNRRLTRAARRPVVAIALVVVGCTQPAVPEDHFYRLQPSAPAAVFETPPISGPVLVGPIRADGPAAQRPILYSERARPFELRQYNYHYWIATPPSMLQTSLIDHLRAANAATELLASGDRSVVGCVLGGHIRRFERLIGEGPSTVVVEVDLRLERAGDRARLWFKSYRVAMQPGDERMDSVVLAFGAAVNRLLDRFLADLSHRPMSCRP